MHPKYRQLRAEQFVPGLSILDALFNVSLSQLTRWIHNSCTMIGLEEQFEGDLEDYASSVKPTMDTKFLTFQIQNEHGRNICSIA